MRSISSTSTAENVNRGACMNALRQRIANRLPWMTRAGISKAFLRATEHVFIPLTAAQPARKAAPTERR